MSRRLAKPAFPQTLLKGVPEWDWGPDMPRWAYHLGASIISCLVISIAFLFPSPRAESWLQDELWRILPTGTPDPSIRLVAFDDVSAYRYPNQGDGIPAEEIELLCEFFSKARPKAVAFISSFLPSTYSQPELEAIAAALAELPRAYLGYVEEDILGEKTPEPLRPFPFFPAYIAKDSVVDAADDLTRRVLVEVGFVPTLWSVMANDLNPQFGMDRSRFVRKGVELHASIRWQGGTNTYPIVSSRQLLNGDLSPELYEDKVVLVGMKRRAHLHRDYLYTPFQAAGQPVAALQAAAHGLVTLMRDDGLRRTPSWLNYLSSILLGILTTNLVLWLSPSHGIAFIISTVVTTMFCCWFSLQILGLETAPVLLLVALVGSYYLVIPFRLLYEFRRRSHYQRKSEWMSELEQLKSKVLSLVSHDLRTPVSTIQGSAELALRDPALPGHLQPRLQTIVHTTDQLNQYVEAVLDMARIESGKVPLEKTTRDINSTIREVAQEKRFLANEKDIDIKLELEPLFSIKYDVKLIRRVLGNLVENAIKYSPEHSEVRLTSQEKEDCVSISVSDNGPGIPLEEQNRVFEKFFRGSRGAASGVNGTGLGLYLVKYFVQLHEGVVKLYSDARSGTTFTIELPLGGGL